MKTFSLPDLRHKPQVFSSYLMNKKLYNFKFMWSNDFCLLDIYLSKDSGNLYILKGYPIMTNTDLISRVRNSDLITGKLFIKNKFNKDVMPDLNTFHTDFELVYYEKGEVVE